MEDKYFIGQRYEEERVITEDLVNQFAEFSLDKNPIHIDEVYASRSRFKKRISHGLIPLSMISALLGNKLPGLGTIYLEQQVNFLKPVFLNTLVKAIVEITNIDEKKNTLKLRTYCTDAAGNLFLDGYAKVLVS